MGKLLLRACESLVLPPLMPQHLAALAPIISDIWYNFGPKSKHSHALRRPRQRPSRRTHAADPANFGFLAQPLGAARGQVPRSHLVPAAAPLHDEEAR